MEVHLLIYPTNCRENDVCIRSIGVRVFSDIQMGFGFVS